MGEDHQVEAPVIEGQVPAQGGGEGVAAGATVNQDAVPGGALDKDGIPLAYVQEGDGEAAGDGGRDGQPQE